MKKNNEFVDHKSILTSGAAGAPIMAITNMLAASFGVPHRLGLIVRGFFVAVTAGYAPMRLAERAVLGVQKALNICPVAFGTAVASAEARTLSLRLDAPIGCVGVELRPRTTSVVTRSVEIQRKSHSGCQREHATAR